MMNNQQNIRPSLENLIESEALGIEILHPGGLEITQELAKLCKITTNACVLDVASGTGETACYLANKLGAQVVGIDGSDLMVERARGKALQRNLSIEFKKGDAHHVPYDDNTFDAVISECTMCLLDKEAALREMVRVAKPGGYVGFHDICWKVGTPEHMKKRLAEIEDERPELLKGWKSLCEMAGLVEVQAIDRSALIPAWMKDTTKKLSLSTIAKVVFRVIKLWGISGLMEIWESEQIFQSKYTGYGIVVGKKPGSSSLTESLS